MKVYIIYDCNEWKEYSSFRFIAVVDEEHLREAMLKIQKERNYTDEELDTYISVQPEKLNDF